MTDAGSPDRGFDPATWLDALADAVAGAFRRSRRLWFVLGALTVPSLVNLAHVGADALTHATVVVGFAAILAGLHRSAPPRPGTRPLVFWLPAATFAVVPWLAVEQPAIGNACSVLTGAAFVFFAIRAGVRMPRWTAALASALLSAVPFFWLLGLTEDGVAAPMLVSVACALLLLASRDGPWLRWVAGPVVAYALAPFVRALSENAPIDTVMWWPFPVVALTLAGRVAMRLREDASNDVAPEARMRLSSWARARPIVASCGLFAAALVLNSVGDAVVGIATPHLAGTAHPAGGTSYPELTIVEWTWMPPIAGVLLAVLVHGPMRGRGPASLIAPCASVLLLPVALPAIQWLPPLIDGNVSMGDVALALVSVEDLSMLLPLVAGFVLRARSRLLTPVDLTLLLVTTSLATLSLVAAALSEEGFAFSAPWGDHLWIAISIGPLVAYVLAHRLAARPLPLRRLVIVGATLGLVAGVSALAYERAQGRLAGPRESIDAVWAHVVAWSLAAIAIGWLRVFGAQADSNGAARNSRTAS